MVVMKKIYLFFTLFSLYLSPTLGMNPSSTSRWVRQVPSRQLAHTHRTQPLCTACIEQDAQDEQTAFNPNQLPLLEAARLGYFSHVPQSPEAFQAAGLDVNATVEYQEDTTQACLSNETGKKMYPVDAGKTLLHYAAQFNNAPIARLLLLAGANPNCTSKNGITPLHTALYLCHTAVLQELLANTTVCATLDTPDEEGNTLLHTMARAEKLAQVKLLLEKGANPTIRNHQGKTPAQETMSLQIVSALQKEENRRIAIEEENKRKAIDSLFLEPEGMYFILNPNPNNIPFFPRPASH
ncbi:hypothetical protein CVU75_01355 [Candidatus Dependentiae bacterium HGW-Dependentiae-1]|nr:MAG: hypothetical protein CVU75_01355 [Candidatus Dependentiae bacterium HGW-Dependentiae-1]